MPRQGIQSQDPLHTMHATTDKEEGTDETFLEVEEGDACPDVEDWDLRKLFNAFLFEAADKAILRVFLKHSLHNAMEHVSHECFIAYRLLKRRQ